MEKSVKVELTTSSDRSFEFSGKLLARTEQDEVAVPGGNVRLRLQIWRTDDELFVPTIDVFTDEDQPRRACEFELVDTESDVENFFFIVEIATIVKELFDTSSLSECESICPDAYATYETCVNRLLALFAKAMAADGTQPSTQPIPTNAGVSDHGVSDHGGSASPPTTKGPRAK